MTIRRANGARSASSAARSKNRHQLLRRNDFALGIRAVARFLVDAPSAKLRHVPESRPLHVFVGDLHHQLRPQRLPRQVLALAPAALPSRHPLPSLCGCPELPRMIDERVVAIGREKSRELAPLLLSEPPANTHLLYSAPIVEKPHHHYADHH